MAKKWINMEEDVAFKKLLAQINWNQSPAVYNIRYYMENLLREHGYTAVRGETGWKVAEKPVEARRIVSKGRTTISEEKIAEIRQKRLEGHSMRSIAKAVGVGVGTVEKYLKF